VLHAPEGHQDNTTDARTKYASAWPARSLPVAPPTLAAQRLAPHFSYDRLTSPQQAGILILARNRLACEEQGWNGMTGRC
jgi:hypothetical protein